MWASLVAVVLSQTCAGFGDGSSGPLNVESGAVQINQAFALTRSAPAGATEVVLDGAATGSMPAPGSLVALHQIQVQTPGGVGAPNLFSARSLNTGHVVFARVASTSGLTVVLTEPLPRGFVEPRAQLVTVPQYTTVNVAAGARLVAPAWNGTAGGLLVLVAQGDVRLDGALDARARGFRGGAPTHGESPDDGGVCFASTAGESFDFNQLIIAPTGTWSAGGGGECSDNGGGGGANGGAGGEGGLADFFMVAPPTRGGAAVTLAADELVFGGGGGAGLGDEVLQIATAGGTGGGAVLVRANALSGAGMVVVDGESALASPSNGAGGGGAGGSITLELRSSLECGRLSARGGNGGDADTRHGVGGGGAGGAIRLSVGTLLDCPRDVSAGLAGRWPDGGRLFGGPVSPDDARSVGTTLLTVGVDAGCGASPGSDGGVASVTIRRPTEGEQLVGSTGCFDGTTNADEVGGSVDGVSLGSTLVLDTGQWRLCTEEGALEPGAHELVVVALDATGGVTAEAKVRFTSRRNPVAVGCGCTSGDVGWLGLAALAWLIRARPASRPAARR